MRFTKMQGCGNDYIYINCFEERVENPEKLAIAMSERHFGVGSDGLVLIMPSEAADFRMRMFNLDGSEGKMCGNASRCVGKYVYERGLTEKTTVALETLGGIKILQLHVKDGIVESVTVDMGEPVLEAAEIPVLSDKHPVIGETVEILDKKFDFTCVSMGNPNCVIHLDEISKEKAMELGPYVENASYFPNRINMQLCKVMDRGHIRVEIYERGAGYTLASGTGACAAAAASHKLGLVDDRIEVTMPGGQLLIEIGEDGSVFLTGEVQKIGTILMAEHFLA